MRLFVALDIPAEVRRPLGAMQTELRPLLPKISWIPENNFHLTLAFLGDIAGPGIGQIRSLLAGVRGPKAIELCCKGLGFFGQAATGPVLLARIAESSALEALATSIGESLRPAGLTLQNRPFIPHLTVGRSKVELGEKQAEILRRFDGHEFGKWHAREFHLSESKLKPTGAEYTSLQSFSFVRETPT